MNGILGFTALLKEPKLTGDEQQQYSVIEKSNRMLNIINNIVSISKIESGQMNLSIRKLQLKVRWNLFIIQNLKLKKY
jgi:signal transduction histidine kinase